MTFRGSRIALFALGLGICSAFQLMLSMDSGAQGLATAAPPAWAYAVPNPATTVSHANDGVQQHVPNSTVTLTLKQITFFHAADWHPETHPVMPSVVAVGRKPNLFACAYCHLPNGQGRPENAALAGLPAAYIAQQVGEIHSGLRRSSQPAFHPMTSMTKVADAADQAEVKTAAAYYAGLTYKPWIKVVQSDVAPRTYVAATGALIPAPTGGIEPLGDRIIEVPEDAERAELRDDTSGSVAYVPPGSVDRGDRLVHSGTGARVACTTCHGASLQGSGNAPPLAGRSPTYLFRQLFDMRSGSRRGPAVALMGPQVTSLSDAEMRNIVAYLATLPP